MNLEPLTTGDPAEVSGYRLQARLGVGGMGRVYLAFTPGGRPVALKTVRPELGDDRDFRNRFYQEVEAARRVHGLYTAQVLDADPAATPPWLVTAYVPGPSLQEAITRYGPMPADAVLVLMAGVAEALHVIHAAGVVHRDLKPSNVLLAPDGPRVIDFGISRAAEATALTAAGCRVGSPQYMAPEQVADRPVSAAADVFALGSLTAYVALGRPAFGNGSEVAIMYRVLHQAADLGNCPPPLRGIIERCLAKEPAQRPTPAEIIRWCRAQTAGRNQQLGQPWVPPAAAPPRPDYAAVPPAVAAGRPGHASVPPPARPGLPARPAGTMRAARPAPAAISGGRPPRRRRGCAARAAMLLSIALILLAAAASAGLHALRESAGGSATGGGSPAAGPSAGSTPPRSWLTGTWIGAADQPAGVITHWTAELSFPATGRAGTFRFPSLGCSGTLVVTSATHATASVKENLTANPQQLCAPGGRMTLTRSGARGMAMTWRDSSRQDNIATARLKLQG